MPYLPLTALLAALAGNINAGPVSATPPVVGEAIAPSLCVAKEGVVLSWIADPMGDPALMMSVRSHGIDGTWSEPKAIVRRADFFMNWADIPRVAQASDGTLWATWLQTSGPGTYAYDIGVARANSLTSEWVQHGTLNDDRTLGEHGFVTLLPEDEGIRAFWLDGRAMSGEGHAGHGSGDMMLRTAMLRDKVGKSTQLDDRVCECCPTAAAAMPLGPAVVVRDRGPEEERDIAIVRNVAGTWLKSEPVSAGGWKINGCPVNGPRIEADGATAAVVWASGGGDHPGLNLAWSSDGGATFEAPIQIDTPGTQGRPALTLVDDGALVAWLDSDDADQWLQVRFVSNDGQLGPVELLARVPEGRRAGIPQMVRTGDHLIVAWTAKDRKKGIDALLLPIATFPRP
ncbi:MAG: glycoside hydrolase [Phycisphaerales bacterium]|nr:glycoside hydrolase [Phycisphaerales bacterium]